MATLTKDQEATPARPGMTGAPGMPVPARGAGGKPAKYPPKAPREADPDSDAAPDEDDGPSGPPPSQRGPTATAAGDDGFFHIHKKGQGYWTRMGTVGGAALIGALTVQFLFSERQTFRLGDGGGELLCVIFSVVYILGCFILLNRPANVDFLIATDSEMKKVNWTSQKELMGSTKVVILFMFIIAAYLFVADMVFGYFFYLIRVLKERPF
jgi:preprotein translocase SecE subunit